MQPRTYARVAAVILLAEGTYAVVHRILGGEYDNFVHLHNVIVDFGLMTIWFTAAVCALFPGPPATLYLVVLGGAASVVHGSIFSLSSATPIGLPFLLAGPVVIWSLVRAAPAWRTTSNKTFATTPASPPTSRNA
jgi:hypothetical protein